MKNTRQQLLTKLFEMVVDCALVLAAFLLAYLLRIGQFFSTDFPFAPYFQLALIITPVFWLFFVWSGLYSLRQKTATELIRMISLSCFSGSMLFVLVFFFKREIFFSRSIVLLIFAFSAAFVFGFHYALQMMRRRAFQNGKGIRRTLVIGNGHAARAIIERFQKYGTPFQPVAMLAPFGGSTKEISGIKVLGKLDALEAIVESEKIDVIVQTEAPEQTLNLLAFAESKFLEFILAPSLLGAFHRSLHSEKIAGMPFLLHDISPIFGWGQLFKRGFDVAVSTLVIIITSPLFLLNKKEQIECSAGAPIRAFDKYRFANKQGFIRYLPEFINVFKGDMSLVGPRPRPPHENELLKSHQRKKLIMRPGIFGLWQLEVLRNLTPDTTKQIELDIRYILRWSFLLDLKILWKSLILLMKR
jgi:lipopolysaccharide/colanic/teichoic acid biosynthesis glycosyltransferase